MLPGTLEQVEELLKQEESWTPEKYAAVLEVLSNVSGLGMGIRAVPTNHGTFELALSVEIKR